VQCFPVRWSNRQSILSQKVPLRTRPGAPDDHTSPTYDMAPGFKPFAALFLLGELGFLFFRVCTSLTKKRQTISRPQNVKIFVDVMLPHFANKLNYIKHVKWTILDNIICLQDSHGISKVKEINNLIFERRNIQVFTRLNN